MVKRIKKRLPFLARFLRNNEGMTLIEVAIAVLLFSVFVVAFISGQGSNVFDSIRFKQEMILRDLAEFKLNEVMLDPPELKETLTTAVPESKKFEEFPEYKYTLEFKKIHIPDYTKLIGEEEGSESNPIQKKIFKTFKDNMEKLTWQVSVTVTHSESNEFFELSTWIYNSEAKVAINPF